jgi:hypothetical protein
MSESTTIDRREFTLKSALAVLAGATITISGCGDDNPTGPTLLPAVDTPGTISNNHGHAATITAAQMSAGGAVTLRIQASSNHDHTVEIAATDITQLRTPNHQPVVKTSSTDFQHSHTVTFS